MDQSQSSACSTTISLPSSSESWKSNSNKPLSVSSHSVLLNNHPLPLRRQQSGGHLQQLLLVRKRLILLVATACVVLGIQLFNKNKYDRPLLLDEETKSAPFPSSSSLSPNIAKRFGVSNKQGNVLSEYNREKHEDHPFLVTIPSKEFLEANKNKNVLVTGASGFIGMHLTLRLLNDEKSNYSVVAFDRDIKKTDDVNTFTSNSDIENNDTSPHNNLEKFVKNQRVDLLYNRERKNDAQVTLIEGNVCDRELLNETFYKHNFDTVIHLASTNEEVDADPETKTSPRKPYMYPLNNEDCFVDLLEVIKDFPSGVKLLYASSSRSYGVSYTVPAAIHKEDDVLSPALTEMNLLEYLSLNHTEASRSHRTNEMIARSYWSLYNVSSIGIRLTQIYGPYGRTDMKHFHLAQQALFSKQQSNDGIDSNSNNKLMANTPQSLMYIDDVIDDIMRLIENDNADIMSTKQGKNRAVVTVVDTGCATNDNEIQNAMGKNMMKLNITSSQIPILNDDIRSSLLLVPVDNNKIINPYDKQRQQQQEHDLSYIGWINQYSELCRADVRTLDDGMIEYMKWIDELNQHGVLTESITRTISRSVSTYNAAHPISSSRLPPRATDLCFVTSMFTSNPSKIDHIKDMSKYYHGPPHKFYFFTNTDEVKCPGWERIVIPDFPHRRMITQSRWPKFMGWMHPKLQTCKTILYNDAHIPPHNLTEDKWHGVTKWAHNKFNKSGLMQRINRTARKFNMTVIEELDRIVERGKDIFTNVEASKEWFRKQPDFNETQFIPGYYNMFLIYNPWNDKFRELSTTFWSHYSSEEQSWRDQPLWRYIVHKLNIIPRTFSKGDKARMKRYYYIEYSKQHTKSHTYTAAADNNAASM